MTQRILTAVMGMVLFLLLIYLSFSPSAFSPWIAAVFLMLYGMGVTGLWWQLWPPMLFIGYAIRALPASLMLGFVVQVCLVNPKMRCDVVSCLVVSVGLLTDLYVSLLQPRGLQEATEMIRQAESIRAGPNLDVEVDPDVGPDLVRAQEDVLVDLFGTCPNRAFVCPLDFSDPGEL